MDTILTLENILHTASYEIVRASSGKEALKLLMQRNFSLILIDVQLSTLNADNIIRSIRVNEKTNSIPVILIAPGSDLTNIMNEYNPGDNLDYIFAPVDPKILSRKIKRAIQRHSLTLHINPHLRLYPVPESLHNSELSLQDIQLKKTMEILEGIAEAYLAIDKSWRVTYYNRAAGQMLNSFNNNTSQDQLNGMCLWELISDDVKEQIYNQLQNAMEQQKPADLIILSCETWFKLRAYPIEAGLTLYCIDITEQKRLEEEVAKLDRLKLMAQLAAGITHEVRNPITVVRAVLDLARLANKPISLDKITLMIEEIDRANSIINEFLSLSNATEYAKELIALDQLVAGIVPLIEAEVHACNKNLVLDLQECNPVYLASKKIIQLIFNLVFNGLEAMKERGKDLTIQTYQEETDVYLKITNQGPAIDVGQLDCIWDPFFTTKKHGTGLGLAICQSIVLNHNGFIQVVTNDRATSFIVRFR